MFSKLLTRTGTAAISVVFLLSAILTVSSGFVSANAQSMQTDKDLQYRKMSDILAKKGSVTVLASLVSDPGKIQERLERYATAYSSSFPEFAGKDSDGSEKKSLPPVFESELKSFTSELRKFEITNFQTSFYSPDVSVVVKSQDQLKSLFSSTVAQRMEENELNDATLMNSNPVIKARDSWNYGLVGAGKNKIIAILDTGVQSSHPFLSGKVKIQACFSTTSSNSTTNCPSGSDVQYGGSSASPCTYSSSCSHGTHVAGIAAGKGPDLASDFHGVAREASIMAVQVFSRFNNSADCNGSAPCTKSFTQDQKDALNYVALGVIIQAIFNTTERISTVNMSLGGGTPTTSYCDSDSRKPIIDTLKSIKVATAIAAGNDGAFGLSTPGCISSAVTVGATNNSDVVASFSNRSPNVDLFAPGVSIYSSVPTSSYSYKSGTSMASPMVAAALAIINDRYPSNTVDQNLKLLKDTAVTVSYTNAGTTYTGKRLKLCKNYYQYGGTWYCGYIIVYPWSPVYKI